MAELGASCASSLAAVAGTAGGILAHLFGGFKRKDIAELGEMP